jgi:hypothetical protein
VGPSARALRDVGTELVAGNVVFRPVLTSGSIGKLKKTRPSGGE